MTSTGSETAGQASSPVSVTLPPMTGSPVAQTPPFSPSPTILPGLTPVAANTAWQPIQQAFDGVEMLLVPAGCFTMGSDSADDDEAPAHRQCLDQPFWIDRSEVTNAEFGSEGLFAGSDRPRDSVSWPEAATYCADRGARLPSEAEWEFAARGPDSLLYPWGAVFSPDVTHFAGNAGGQSAPVGSYPGGTSWVGALDMVGNLWEWTSTLYDQSRYPYPYTASDGREDVDDQNSFRVIRGGSLDNEATLMLAVTRKAKHPTGEWYGYVGFRCAMDL